MWQRLYGLWIEHEAELCAGLGHAQAEAPTRDPGLAERTSLTATLRRPRD
ncbi:hypothetical protein ACIP10_34590 [Streptomyces galbus]